VTICSIPSKELQMKTESIQMKTDTLLKKKRGKEGGYIRTQEQEGIE
jgi:hypothetical protein